jgi:predicted amidohydrolase YtcJ
MDANLVFLNADVHTMDADQPHAQAVAVAGKRILAVGEDAKVRSLLGAGGQVVDLGGRTVIPGLIDAHVHFGGHSMALYQRRLDLDNVPSKEEALARVTEQAVQTPPGRWIQGGGWNKSIWPDLRFPTAGDLDAVVPEHPVVLADKSRHAVWVNTLALELAGITATSEAPAGGEILRDESGQPTGLLLETAVELVYEAVPEPDLEMMVEALRQAIPRAHRLGLTGFHDPGDPTVMAALQVLRVRDELGLRALIHIPSDGLDHAIKLGLRSGLGNNRLRVGGIKIFADGALGPQTAHMLAPFEGSENNVGIPTLSAAEMFELVLRAYEAGLSVVVHAIGDGANRATLDAIESVRAASHRTQAGESGVQYPTLPDRIEHVQLLHPDDLPRLTQLGVVASMQPIHASSDMDMAERHWGRRCDYAYAWQDLLQSGAWLAFGSDAPVESMDPLAGIHAAVTRRRADGSPGPEGWIPDQRLTVDQAVQAYTLGAAQAAGEAHLKGSLTPGKLADLVVLSHDIFRVEPMSILDARVEMTIFDGRIVYQA